MKTLNRNSLASIIIVNYNNAPFLSQCVKSILNQTYKNIEIIIVKNTTNNYSLDELYKYQNKIKIIIC